MTRRLLTASFVTLLAYVWAFFSLWIQVDPFAGDGTWLPMLAAGTGMAFALAAWILAGSGPPRGFALVGLGLGAAAFALAGVVAGYS